MKNRTNAYIYALFRYLSLTFGISLCLVSPIAVALISNSTPSKITVGETTTQNISATSSQTSENVPHTQVANAAITATTTIPVAVTQRETPSKIAQGNQAELLASSAVAPAPISAPVATVPAPLEQPSATSSTEPLSAPSDTPAATRQATPSKVAVGEDALALMAASATQTSTSGASGREGVPVLEASITPVPASPQASAQTNPSANPNNAPSSRRQNSVNALNAFLSSPAKTPVASLQAQTTRSSNLPFEVTAQAVLIVDQDTREVLYSKNAMEILPIASITKLMTAMVILDANQSMSQRITITQADVDTLRNSSSRLAVGTRLTRRELLHLTLMSSENRAAHALARNYPGGLRAFIAAMNNKAQALGMTQTSYVDPTGLSNQNRSSARDLVWLVKAAYQYTTIRQLSTSSNYRVSVGRRQLSYTNTNRLTDNPNWHIGLQKTGFIREAGHCLVMQTTVSGRNIIMVFLNADDSTSRLLDAEKIRNLVTRQTQQYATSAH